MSLSPPGEFTFSTTCGHHGTIKHVKAKNGPYAGHWICRISGPKVTGASGIKTVFARPDKASAQMKIGGYLRLSHPWRDVQCAAISRPSLAPPPSSPPAAARIKQESASNVTPSPVRATSSSSAATSTGFGEDKWEVAPNGMSKCKTCHHKIQKGDSRIGKWTYYQEYNKYQYAYYHQGCVSTAFKASLQLPDPKVAANRQRLLFQRRHLREQLRQLRLAFARRLALPPYCIFNDNTLDDITVRLPENKADLCACYGIKEKKYQNFGSSILAITTRYDTKSGQHFSVDSEDNDAVIPDETLSCEAIVEQQFQHAKENGYVIAIV